MPVVSSQKQHYMHEFAHKSGKAKSPFVKSIRSQTKKKSAKRGSKR